MAGVIFGLFGTVFFFMFFFEFENYYIDEPEHYYVKYIVGVVGFVSCYIFLSPTQIVVTDTHIVFRNLLLRTSSRIKYDEIAEVDRKFVNNAKTSMRTRIIKLKNGKVISFDDNTYRNFKEIDNCILENIRKNSLSETH